MFEQLPSAESVKRYAAPQRLSQFLATTQATFEPPLTSIREVLLVERRVRTLRAVRFREFAFNSKGARLLIVEHNVEVRRSALQPMWELTLKLERLVDERARASGKRS